MDIKRKALIVALLLQRRKKRHKRRLWVHPNLQKRDELGEFNVLFEELRKDEIKFFEYFKMSTTSFDELHCCLKTTLQRHNSGMRNCIRPVEMLAVSVRFLAAGSTFTQLHYTYRLGISTISKIVRDVCAAIWNILHEKCFPQLTKEHYEKVTAGFERKANFPHCIGAVTLKQIRLSKPQNGVSNYKGYLVLFAICDTDYRFSYMEMDCFNMECDSAIFKEFPFWKRLQSEKINVPDSKPFSGTESPRVPYYFLGDETFPMCNKLLRPYANYRSDIKRKMFNNRLIRATRFAECSFALLSNKWEVLQRPLNVHPELALDIVRACMVLHNFVLDRDGYRFEDTLTIVGLTDVTPSRDSLRGGLHANTFRNNVADYFKTDAGSLPWQTAKI